MIDDYNVNKNNNKIWINHIYNHQVCSKKFGFKSHLIDFIFYLNNQNVKSHTSGGNKVVTTNL